MRNACVVFTIWALGACASGGERRRSGVSDIQDPYGGSEQEQAELGETPLDPPPTDNRIELGAELDGHRGMLVEQVPQGACHPGPQQAGRADLQEVLEALESSQPALQRCYDNARLQHDPENTGITVAIEATFAENGCLERAIVADDNVLSPLFTMCVADAAKEWAIPTHAERSKHRFNLDLAPTGDE